MRPEEVLQREEIATWFAPYAQRALCLTHRLSQVCLGAFALAIPNKEQVWISAQGLCDTTIQLNKQVRCEAAMLMGLLASLTPQGGEDFTRAFARSDRTHSELVDHLSALENVACILDTQDTEQLERLFQQAELTVQCLECHIKDLQDNCCLLNALS